MRFQDKISKIDNDQFIKRYIAKKCKNIDLSEQRSVVKETYENGKTTYKVVFEYLLVKHPTFFSNLTETAKKTVIDVIDFNDYNEAEFYASNAAMPSAQFGYQEEYFIYNDLYLKNVEHINELYSIVYVKDGKLSTGEFKVIYEYNSYYGRKSKLFYNLKSVIEFLMDSFPENFISNVECVKTIDVADTVQIKKADIKTLKESLEKSKNDVNDIVINEIERTNNYLDLLKTMIQ